ncbi:ketose-bisphosphate aldolase class-ii [Lucifera butyrica]|uniref:Ketose-bisphosphate aldolase class-ii n=1 Tax=Lucifera butyrica TaxID=1351585 RepID=A0A498R2D7_9FIRM|nr:class II fructose-bisphosphate aldolase [Lucifera butyrica]VBB04930.1 ketose-bisphosphate aldolase class-ii [Lucifera butyrica]
MLVNLSDILGIAEAKKCAIGSFNTPNLESILAVIDAAEELKTPVIIMHAQVHEELIPLSIIGPIMLELARNASVPVCVHLDHGSDLALINKAISLGFTSVMYDGSQLPYQENAANSRIVVGMASKAGVSVEGEIGVLGRRETGNSSELPEDAKDIYTDPDTAFRFVQETRVNALACSFGTAHGIYLKKPKLDMNLLGKIKEKVNIPLVMHGGSGVSDEDYLVAIEKGIRKINYYTYMSKAGGETVKTKLLEHSNEIAFYHNIAIWGCEAMKNNVKSAMEVFAKSHIPLFK